MRRRELLLGTLLAGAARAGKGTQARVLVVGGGYGGAMAARWLRRYSKGSVEVTLVESGAAFVSCPLSNLVLEGSLQLSALTRSYAALAARDGVQVLRDTVLGFDPVARTATLASGRKLAWDKLVLSPGVDMIWDAVEGLRAAHDAGRILQAWKAGPETLTLRRQLEAMPEGGVFAIAIPEAPYRCPPAPYERACVVAAWLKRAKPRAKVLVIDANEDITSKPALFRKVWADSYKGLIEYQPQTKTVAVDGNTLKFEIQEDLKADVLNVLPPMRAGAVAVQGGLANSNGRWVGVRFPDFESVVAKDVHVIGDSIQIAPGMPKSGHMAMSQGRALAALLAADLTGQARPDPRLESRCYSFVDARRAMHIASEHEYVAAEKTYLPVHGAGGSSDAPSEAEGEEARDWARRAWDEMLA
ncbi:FCSD flavin-binding domain-containing protein [Pelomonas sp. KK5]|uniref:FCSD flavin-binding domain-containing protein n=1 Tax=Pelomonas sp. KK5 TaxID=1855730 RepID=UPI00097C1878|nr:FCSD flavin-binding domain-containing protein [Pelomonas sp. KK5]